MESGVAIHPIDSMSLEELRDFVRRQVATLPNPNSVSESDLDMIVLLMQRQRLCAIRVEIEELDDSLENAFARINIDGNPPFHGLSPSRDLENRDTNAVTEFTKFSELPVELRRKIWRESLPGPRVVKLRRSRYRHGMSHHGSTSQAKTPVALRVNHESRTEALLIYILSFGFAGCEPKIYFNFAQDTLFIDTIARDSQASAPMRSQTRSSPGQPGLNLPQRRLVSMTAAATRMDAEQDHRDLEAFRVLMSSISASDLAKVQKLAVRDCLAQNLALNGKDWAWLVLMKFSSVQPNFYVAKRTFPANDSDLVVHTPRSLEGRVSTRSINLTTAVTWPWKHVDIGQRHRN